ncbi:MAG: DNA-processing protein DprA [Cyanobium sp.]
MGDLVRGVFPLAAPSAAALAGAPSVGDFRQRLWWLLWSQCPGIGGRRLRRLQLISGGLEAAWRLPVEVLAVRMGWPRSLGPSVDQFRGHWGEDPLPRLARAERGGRCVLMPGDRRWPEAMEVLDRPPPALYWNGCGSIWASLARRRAVAVVGTRRPSSHGLLMASRIGAALAAAGWPVVSGLAEGIDGAAHEGCLAAGGAPVGVLGTPLDRTYPRHHRSLQQQVARQGLLLSEWPVGAPVRPGHFASRNRLQVALAWALVLVECPLASGALQSADLAWAQGLPLWVVPADAARASALGSNRLLARGATPLIMPSDLIDQLGPGPLAGRAWPSLAAVSTGQDSGDRLLGEPDPRDGAAAQRSLAAEAVREPAAFDVARAASAADGAHTAAAAMADRTRDRGAPAGADGAESTRDERAVGAAAAGGGARQRHGAEYRLDSAGRRLLAAVGAGASLEQISQALGQPAEQLAPGLLDLELAGLLRAEAGLQWRPAAALWQQGSA